MNTKIIAIVLFIAGVGFLVSRMITNLFSQMDGKEKSKMSMVVLLITIAIAYSFLQHGTAYSDLLFFGFTLGFLLNLTFVLQKWVHPIIILGLTVILALLMSYLDYLSVMVLAIYLAVGYTVYLFMRIWVTTESGFLNKVVSFFIGLFAWLFLVHTILGAIITI